MRRVISDALAEMRRRPIVATALVLVALAAGAVAYALVAYHVQLRPLKLSDRSLSVGAASTSFLVDRRTSSFADGKSNVEPLLNRSRVYADLMTSDEILTDVAARLDIPRDQLTAQGPPTELSSSGIKNTQDESLAQQRASQLVSESAPYRLGYDIDQLSPVVKVYASAPTAKEAGLLAAAPVAALRTYLSTEQRRDGFRKRRAVKLRVLGDPVTGTVGEGNRTRFGILAGVFAFLLVLATGLGIWRVVSNARIDAAARRPELRRLDPVRPLGLPAGAPRAPHALATTTDD